MSKDAANILPDLYPQQELFLCDLGDVVAKDDMGSMAHPVFSLSKRPDHKIRRYEAGDTWLEVQPSAKGRATIYDKDLIIFCVSQLMAAKRQGRQITDDGRHLVFNGADFLRFTNRRGADSKAGGSRYTWIRDALDRLAGTRLVTNVRTGGIDQTSGRGLIEAWDIVSERKGGGVLEWRVSLSEWLFRAVLADEVLTLHRDYFRLKSSLERRIYEIARKHCGAQPSFKIGLDKLQAKCGSLQAKRNFKLAVQAIADNDTLPEYDLWLDDKGLVHFQNRAASAQLEASAAETAAIRLDPETYHDARAILNGWDIYQIEQEWRAWITSPGMEAPRNPDAAFLGFCQTWKARNG